MNKDSHFLFLRRHKVAQRNLKGKYFKPLILKRQTGARMKSNALCSRRHKGTKVRKRTIQILFTPRRQEEKRVVIQIGDLIKAKRSRETNAYQRRTLRLSRF